MYALLPLCIGKVVVRFDGLHCVGLPCGGGFVRLPPVLRVGLRCYISEPPATFKCYQTRAQQTQSLEKALQ